MSAGPYLWLRLRRRVALACMRARVRQIEQLCSQLDRQICADMKALAALQVERRQLLNRITFATRPARAAEPLTWGL